MQNVSIFQSYDFCVLCIVADVNNAIKFQHETLIGFQVPFQRAITQKIRNPELWFLCSARRLMLVNNPVKFHYLRYLKGNDIMNEILARMPVLKCNTQQNQD